MRWHSLAAIACLQITLMAAPVNNFVYQIFVRSFADTPGDRHGAGEIGDLRGIRENLDYINDGRPGNGADLEAGILWLMPIFPSGTYHGYDIDDYRAVNPEYGTMQDLQDLIRESHRRGVRIILDIAFNHTSLRHPWFHQAVQDSNSSFRRFYFLRTPLPLSLQTHWHKANDNVAYFGLFSSRMPDLNVAEPAVRRELKAVAKFWLDKAIDGFRLDAAKHIFDDGIAPLGDKEISENNRWWREFSAYVHSLNPSAILIGEVLGPTEILRKHAAGLKALLDDPFMHRTREHLVSPKPGFLARWMESTRSFESWAFLGSHDATPRLASFLKQRVPKRFEETYRAAMHILFAISQRPILYSGDEIMQLGVKWPGSEDGSRIYDETLREPLPWRRDSKAQAPQTRWFPPRYDKPNDGVSVEEQDTPGSLLHLVRSLGALRSTYPDFANSPIDSVLSDTAEKIVFTRGNYLALTSLAPKHESYRVPASWRNSRLVFWSDAKAKQWKATSTRISSEVSVPPFGFILLQRQR